MSVRTRKSVKASCDRLWSHLVRVRARGRCERCDITGRMEAHHVYGRTDHRLRFEPRNGTCLCHPCHRWAEQFPKEFAEWHDEHRPADAAFLRVERAKGLRANRTLHEYLELEAQLRQLLDAEFPCEAA